MKLLKRHHNMLFKLEKSGFPVDFGINYNDKNGFMASMKDLDRTRGLDSVLHTLDGDIAAVESIVECIHSMFDDVGAIILQAAFSGGTMIVMSCKNIVMGKQSSLGYIDPQFRSMSASGIVDEFSKAQNSIKKDPNTMYVWQPIIAKYLPTLIGECNKAILWANELACEWLQKGIIENVDDKKFKM